AGSVLELGGALAQQPRRLGADEVDEGEVGDGEQVVAGIGGGDEGAGALAVHGPAVQSAGRHGDVAEVEQLRGGGLVLVGRRARGGAVGGAAARSSGAARGDGAARGGRAVSVGVGRARGRGGFGPGEVVGQGGDGEHGAGGAEVVVPEAGGKAAVQEM